MIRWNSHSHKNKTSHKVAQAWTFLAAYLEDGNHYLAWEGQGPCPCLPWWCLQEMRAQLGHRHSCAEQSWLPQAGKASWQPRAEQAWARLALPESWLVETAWMQRGCWLCKTCLYCAFLTTFERSHWQCSSLLQQVPVWQCDSQQNGPACVWGTVKWGQLWHTSGFEYSQVLQNSCASWEPGEGSLFFSICFMFSRRQKKCCPLNSHLGIPHLQQVLFK